MAFWKDRGPHQAPVDQKEHRFCVAAYLAQIVSNLLQLKHEIVISANEIKDKLLNANPTCWAGSQRMTENISNKFRDGRSIMQMVRDLHSGKLLHT